jgi:hypothetical protein
MASSIKIFQVNSWGEIVKSIKKARSILDLRDDEELWYRGVSSRNHQLLPSLHRCLKEKAQDEQKTGISKVTYFSSFLRKRALRGEQVSTTGTSCSLCNIIEHQQGYSTGRKCFMWRSIYGIANMEGIEILYGPATLLTVRKMTISMSTEKS